MLHTLYYSTEGDIDNYFSVYKLYLDKEEVSFLSFFLSLLYSCNYYYLLGPYTQDNVSQGKSLIYKKERQSTPYGKVFIPLIPQKDACYVQTKDYDIAFNFTPEEKETFLYINKIFKLPYEFYDLQNK
jgi:hypothetical protein